MIHSKAFDVEIFPNLFSVVFVNLKDYFNTFTDCVDDKGKPIPLTEKLTVAEINRRLDTIPTDIFRISDTDDSQLLSLVAYINNMEIQYVDRGEGDNVKHEVIRYDLYGFNILGYDDNMIKAFMMNFNRCNSTKDLIRYLYETSKKIIALQNDKDAYFGDKSLELIRKYRLPYVSVDIQQIYGLHAARVDIDKNTKERLKFGKSLKQTAVNLKWHEILDFKLPPIDEEEAKYYRKQDQYRGMPLEELNLIITSDFDRYVLPKYVDGMTHYNKNDVFLVAETVRQNPDEVRLRYSITNAFGIRCLSSARANIADKLTTKFYSEMSGLPVKAFKDKRTERTRLSFNKIIFPHIQFKTPELQRMLAEMKKVYVYHTNKDDFIKEIDFYGTKYTLACGGIHTQDMPKILISDDKVTYIHFDYNSYYPSIVISYMLSPEHLNKAVFVKMVKYFRDTRVKCKHTPDSEGYIIAGVPNKISAEALKIVINSIYGKFGSDTFFLYDRFTQLQVTINGQLMTMSLVEELELNGIHVISANTDGIIIRLPNDKKDLFAEITARWNEVNKMQADSEEYKALYIRDVNNYFAVWLNGKIEAHGALDTYQYRKELKKGYNAPIVAKAAFEYLYNNVPVMETLRNHKDILDFCKTQNVGRQFDVCYDAIVDGKLTTVYHQKDFRYFVSLKGVILFKEHKLTKARNRLGGGLKVSLLSTLDDMPIEERGINYKYYYDECYKLINPIMLQTSPNVKGGKKTLKKYSQMYNTLFDLEE